ncbi:MAG: hypothetical protein A2402_01055 [Candidatus Staskawiczbacteria bacterium RIFOXYC1_FULL_37_43]|nr:MAG: hypothetical protein A2402_01055 [Candidatus Staskawiczbacteria bacterium RIFOXYC1_FULL_37_43]OGZ85136.1 MAG: hypothetical protein A2490_01765 [Candidatus Staskawiczbacteria bacterium RIFOXYC12_FULL_39_20]HCC60118.1 hypothetical protein [Candidatus Staskawiczbacteria bacterium]
MMSKKLPSFSQWKQIFKILKKTEKRVLIAFIILAIASFAWLAVSFYINATKSVPTYGGTYTEGIVGQPRFINPIYGETNDVDRTLIGLIYSGIMTYDKDGNIAPDLVEDYHISEDGRTYTFQLKDNLFWQDGVPLAIDDIIFTIKTIQNSDYKSPLRANWLDVGIEKVSDKTFVIFLQSPYNSFLENCALKIIPKHIWENIVPENFTLSSYNLQPIGSGPYMISDVKQAKNGSVKSILLKANRRYYSKLPYISELSFQFFNTKEELAKAANQKTIDGFSLAAFDNDQTLAEKEIHQGWSDSEKFNFYSFLLPRYFAVFFNPQKFKSFEDPNLTIALNYSVNKAEIINNIKSSSKNNVFLVNSPILPQYFGYSEPEKVYEYNLDLAKELLDKAGFKEQNGSLRAKENNKEPAFKYKSYLKIGSKGNEVTELQGCLSRLDSSFENILKGETSGTYGKGTEEAVTEFQKKYLPDEKPTGETGPATRKKLNELCPIPQENLQLLKFTITTINQPQTAKVAELLKDYWQKIGAEIEIKTADLSELKSIIKNRDYDALLYGQALGLKPDLYPFWHSSQTIDPGLNLAGYKNKDADQLLKTARETLDMSEKALKYEQLQNIIIKDAPAVFLYNPGYIYWASKKVKGIDTIKIVDPAKRFVNIENWYINTKRVLK